MSSVLSRISKACESSHQGENGAFTKAGQRFHSILTDAETFGELVVGEMRRRKIIQTECVCAVTDGADWLQRLIDLHRPDAVRIPDFPHVAEHAAALNPKGGL